MPKKNKTVQPDDYFSAGPIQIARFGKNVIFQSDWSEGAFDEMQKKLVERFPEVLQNIDCIICKIVDLVITLPPESVLQRAWSEMAVRHLNIASESDATSEDIVSVRMVDYLQSVIAAVKPSDVQKNEITENDWQSLRSLIKELFNKLNHDYHICLAAIRKKEKPYLDANHEEFYYKAQVYWCNVRGNRYSCHEEEYLRDFILPHSAIFNKLFGITAEQLIAEMMKIQHALTKGMIEAAVEFADFREATMNALETLLKEKGQLTQGEEQELMAKVIKDNGWEDWQADLFGRFFGLDLFDLEKVTQIPRSLLNELSWEQGQDKEFFSDGEFRGWPLRIWPVFKRPFIKLNGRYYCFDLHSLFDNLYRVLQKKVLVLNKDYVTEWNQKQQETSEQLPFKYLTKLLPGAEVYRSVYYKWRTGDVGKKQWCETDGLLIYDDHLFIIEVKAGAFTYTSPANDFPAYIDSIQNLVLKPAVQGNRFVEYLKSDETVPIFDEKHNSIGQLSLANFRHIVICPITLDTFTELAAQVQHLKALGVNVGKYPVWSISIDDLRVYTDIFDDPLIFLHFVEQRMRAFKSDIIQTDDELDHVGLYIKHNIYTQYAEKLKGDGGAEISFVGYRAEVDKYFTHKLHEPSIPSPLNQEMPKFLIEIISILSAGDKLGKSRVASYLLDCGGSCRINIADSICQILENQK